MKKLIFIVGPTASGKSNLAINLAKKYGGEIISCDSIQVYQGLEVGSAKPSLYERSLVPHFLIDVAPVGSRFTAGDFRKMALSRIEDSHENTFYIVGGTGFYFKALEFGMHESIKADEAVKEVLKEEFKNKGSLFFYNELEKLDPDYAKVIHKNDTYRLFRAIELIQMGFLPSKLDQNFQKKYLPYPILKMGVLVNREDLRIRVRSRIQKMLDNGFIDEVRELVNNGYIDWEPLKSVGYKEVLSYINGSLRLEELCTQIEIKTMQLAKKQMTWFNKDKSIHWTQLSDLNKVENLVGKFLEKD